MFRFTRQKILPLFLQRRITMTELARLADISYQSAQRAIEGKAVSAAIVSKIAEALNFTPIDFLEMPEVEQPVMEMRGGEVSAAL